MLRDINDRATILTAECEPLEASEEDQDARG
jgi:hypothetical protein